MENILDIISRRYSCRTYNHQFIEEDKYQKLLDYLAANNQGPFGNKVRFKLLGTAGDAAENLNKYISYGNIKGCRTFMVGTVEKGLPKAMEDYGYCMEKNILFATSLGLNTVWIGGLFKRSVFSEKMSAPENEVIPAISPVGYAADRKSMIDLLLTTTAGSRKRKPFGELFFSNTISTPLDKSACGRYGDVLEAVRWAPSASNRQPWRIIKEQDKDIFHFYMDENPGYNNIIKDVKLQNMDLGIAMCHFELSAQYLGLKGCWHTEEPSKEAESLVYITSWIG